MQRAEPELLEAFATDAKLAGEKLEERYQSIIGQAMQGLPEEHVSLGTAASLLLVGSAEGVTVDEQTGVQFFSWMITRPPFDAGVRKGPYSVMLKKLLGMWLVKDTGAVAAGQNLFLASAYELKPEALNLANRVLANERSAANTRQNAILIVGKFGGKENAATLEKLLSDATNCSALPVNTPRQMELQIRDVALAVLVHLTGQNLRDYGFASAQPYAPTLFQAGSLMFGTAIDREAALKKWARWRAEHPDA